MLQKVHCRIGATTAIIALGILGCQAKPLYRNCVTDLSPTRGSTLPSAMTAPSEDSVLLWQFEGDDIDRPQTSVIDSDPRELGVWPESDSFRIVAFADNQYGCDVFSSFTVPATKMAEPDFVLTVGDMVQNGENLLEWKTQFYQPMQDILETTPWFPVRGNHDGEGAIARKMAPLPGDRGWYARSIHGVRLVILDSNLAFDQRSPQGIWLAQELSSVAWRDASLRAVALHYPPYTSYWHRSGYDGEPSVRDGLLPRLLGAGVDLVLSGHAHVYERGTLLNAFGRATHLITTGGAGAGLDRTRTAYWPHISKSRLVHHILVMDFDPSDLVIRAIGTDDQLTREIVEIDSVTIPMAGAIPCDSC